MWVFYDGGRPPGTGTTVEESGFTITVKDKNGQDITGRIMGGAQTSGDDGDSLQFFIETFKDPNNDGMDDKGVDGDTITVTVAGLGSFTFTAPPATFQSQPL